MIRTLSLLLWLTFPFLLPAATCPPEQTQQIAREIQTARNLSAVGTSFAQRRVYPCAILAFEKALALDPSYTNARFNLGLALLNTGASERAVKEWKSILETKPDLFEVRLSLGSALLELGRYDEAEEHLKAALELSPGHPQALFALAMTYLSARKNEAAIATLEKASAGAPNADLQILLAGAYSNSRNFAKAYEILTKANEAFPENAQIHLGLGTLHEIEGRLERAIVEYEHAARINPKSAEIESRLANVRRRLAEPPAKP